MKAKISDSLELESSDASGLLWIHVSGHPVICFSHDEALKIADQIAAWELDNVSGLHLRSIRTDVGTLAMTEEDADKFMEKLI